MDIEENHGPDLDFGFPCCPSRFVETASPGSSQEGHLWQDKSKTGERPYLGELYREVSAALTTQALHFDGRRFIFKGL